MKNTNFILKNISKQLYLSFLAQYSVDFKIIHLLGSQPFRITNISAPMTRTCKCVRIRE